ncbi:hypothetical protein [Bauldia sp.]|uniref:hypothetical protein n=1 Tax=Bauldia sp. TaxID=2575872 RepID=UPI003BAC88E8
MFARIALAAVMSFAMIGGVSAETDRADENRDLPKLEVLPPPTFDPTIDVDPYEIAPRPATKEAGKEPSELHEIDAD